MQPHRTAHSATQRSVLVTHMRTHTGEKTFYFEDGDCQYVAAQRRDLINHMRTRHNIF
jgi:hypothetical protein